MIVPLPSHLHPQQPPRSPDFSKSHEKLRVPLPPAVLWFYSAVWGYVRMLTHKVNIFSPNCCSWYEAGIGQLVQWRCYGIDDPGFKSRQEQMISIVFRNSIQPHIKWVEESCMVVNRPGPEPDHSPPSSMQVKKEWIIPPFPLHAFMVCKGIPLHFQFIKIFIYN